MTAVEMTAVEMRAVLVVLFVQGPELPEVRDHDWMGTGSRSCSRGPVPDRRKRAASFPDC